MLTTRYGNIKPSRVKFVSYTGEFPNLCSGVLTLEIDGVVYQFKPYGYDGVTSFQCFWSSGGGITEDYDCYQGEWIIDYESLPEELRKYALEIDRAFNENVTMGCCGGCS